MLISFLVINMTTKKQSKNIKKVTDDTNFDTKVENYLAERGFARRIELIEYLERENKDKIGYSRVTIAKKLSDMVTDKKLVRLGKLEQEKYGIVSNDKKAVYYALASTADIKNYLDEIFDLLKKDNIIDQKLVLVELESYKKRYVLDREQLDTLVSKLESPDVELVNTILRILDKNILEKGARPNDEKQLVKNLKSLLTRYPRRIDMHPNLRPRIIFLLGYYKDDAVIKQLIMDAKTIENLEGVKYDYWSKYTAEIIESHRRELFELMRELEKSGEHKRVQFLNEIKYNALHRLGLVDSDIRFEPRE